jgi:2-keto-4-pentenoate hydratase/2-oxohepta-3-ene-1,7-dioic acid hydratase in catechol pathway
MRLARYDHDGRSAIGVLEDGVVREVDVSGKDGDMPPIIRAARTDGANETGVEHAREDVHLRPPVSRPGKIVCLGLNYAEHADRGGNEIPDEPLLFSKPSSAVVGPEDPIVSPSDVEQLDHESELAIVIGRSGRRIDRGDALSHVAGYTAFNDVSARDVQYRYSQYFRGKGYDTFAPMGPAMTTRDAIDPGELSIRALVNGEVRQDSSTADMIFPVREVIESVSRTMTLNPGDVIATGTPPGVGIHRDPPLLLDEGDEVVVELEGIGSLANEVVREEQDPVHHEDGAD